jgi:Copper transport outer membrane protein, MctB
VISFRFHLVSLVAVFMALGLGVLAGTTVINRGIVRQLEDRTLGLERDRDQFRQEVLQLGQQLEAWIAFGDQIMPHLVDNELTGQQAIMVTEQWTDEATVASVEQGLRDADADVVALLSVGERMALPTEADRLALAEAIGVQGVTDPAALRTQTAAVLADRLAVGPLGEDVLDVLIRDEFLLNQGSQLGEEGLRDLAGADLIVAVAGGAERPPLPPEGFLVPFVESAAAGAEENDQAVGAAESVASGYEFVTILRGNGETADRIVTQDNVDQIPGRIGLVMALDALLVSGVPGHYGVKDGTDGVIPPPDAG